MGSPPTTMAPGRNMSRWPGTTAAWGSATSLKRREFGGGQEEHPQLLQNPQKVRPCALAADPHLASAPP
jgi:hypothetical protein